VPSSKRHPSDAVAIHDRINPTEGRVRLIKMLEEIQFDIRYQTLDKCSIERKIRNVMKEICNDNSSHALHRDEVS
jgi:hypothetical protein